MMNDQKILDNAPKGALGIKIMDGFYRWVLKDNTPSKLYECIAFYNYNQIFRSLADIKELVELRNANATLELTCKSRANSINEMSNMIAELQKANTELEKERDSMLHEVAKQYDGDGLSEWAIGANHVFMLFAKWVSSKRSKALKVGK
jgi:hypothetical protein